MYQIPKFVRSFPKFCVASKVFSPEEVKKIIDLEALERFQRGQVGDNSGKSVVNKKARESSVMWLEPNQNSEWLFRKFAHVVAEVNYDLFCFDIKAFGPFQYTVYGENEFYDWHIDEESQWSEVTRKISATVLLSDPKDYDGGEFEIIPYGMVNEPEVYKPAAGDIIFFASHMPHRVRPVTRGVRKSLVSWILGPWQ
jgi:PKHD-type hydroxylase